MNWFEDLQWRGLINSITNNEKLDKFMQSNAGVYIGFDPSASSLHLGNYVMIMVLRRLKNQGIPIFPVVGGATGMIGDPSGKSDERNLLSDDVVVKNKIAIIEQLKKYTKSEIVLDNLNNYKEMNFLDFLRNVGKFVSINYLLEKEIIKNRLETTGISYTEFSYNLIQSYDFVQFYKNYNVHMQIGGSDQWGNITAGIEMIRKMFGDNNNAVGLTINLLTNSEGKKFGKSEKGAIFLDPQITSPYEMYQYLINQPDSEVIKILKMLTLLTKEEIEQIENLHQQNPSLRHAQKALADWLVNDIHGEYELNKVKQISNALFTGNIKEINFDDLKQALLSFPTSAVHGNRYNIVDFLVNSNIVASKTQARQLISSNSIMINGDKINDLEFTIDKTFTFNNEYTVVKKGKKNYFVVKWN